MKKGEHGVGGSRAGRVHDGKKTIKPKCGHDVCDQVDQT